jgi:hypothetical protein
MTKKKEKSSTDECPVEFLSGTFCRIVLQEPMGGELSLIQVLPSMKAIIHLSPGTTLPEVPLGSLYAYCLFKRKPGHPGPLAVQLDADICFPGQSSSSTGAIALNSEHEYGQLGMKLINPSIREELKPGKYQYNCQVILRFGGSEIAKVEMPVIIEVVEVNELQRDPK